MINENQEYKSPNHHFMKFLVGMLMGGLAGAVIMLLLAPQSGKKTRKQIQVKGIKLRDWTNEIVEVTMAQVSSSEGEITISG